MNMIITNGLIDSEDTEVFDEFMHLKMYRSEIKILFRKYVKHCWIQLF